ncbi:MAG: YafY family protein [Alphaproteobacteria bacterium]|nr:YafY family protein [Alphaproteobacteria bacterium]
MRRAERLFRLVNELRTRHVSRAHDLAERFEVSVSTIYRDIAHLQGSGLPIEGEAGVGYMLRPGFDLPAMTFTHDQIDALAVGLSFVESAGDPTLAAAARETRAKIQANLPAPEERKLADAPYFSLQKRNDAARDVGLVREAIRRRQVLRIRYRNGEGRPSERQVRPLVVWNLTDGWMFSAWCELRGDFRTFRFDRLSSISTTDDIYMEDKATGLRAFLAKERREAKCRVGAPPSPLNRL